NVSEASNISGSVNEFILLGFPCRREIQILFFVIFSFIYLLTLMGNLSIICAVWSSRKLHTSMYILLANFSFLEICHVCSNVPKLLANIISQTKNISYAGCMVQFTSPCALQRATFCLTFALSHHNDLSPLCWAGGFLSILIPAILMSWVPFCGPNIIDHFFCDLGPLLALSCALVPKTTLICVTVNSLIIFLTFLYILGSYALVLGAVRRNKSFSTYASHFLVVFLFYSSVMVMYVSPGSRSHPGTQKFVILFYCMATPFFNPLIYSLQNKDMKDALKKVLRAPSKVITK
uniref:G-protein coupled receptors family 1 profile domain-containing protein n=1 Tax=Loxodonta africana TaxID=9785 RepID=G3U0G9_LOXAF